MTGSESKESKLAELKVLYNEILFALENDCRKDAEKMLYEMPVDLYDLSLDILDNRNEKISDESLRKLIENVDKIINPTLISDNEV